MIRLLSRQTIRDDGEIIMVGKYAMVTHPFDNFEKIVRTELTKRFLGESSGTPMV